MFPFPLNPLAGVDWKASLCHMFSWQRAECCLLISLNWP